MHLDSSDPGERFQILPGSDRVADDTSPNPKSPVPDPLTPKPQPPDLSPLPRAAAAAIELLAEAAAIHFAGRIRMAEALLEKAPNPGRYRDTLAGELAMRRAHLAEARTVETAARRRRVEPLSEEEHVLLDLAREQSPDASGSDMDALLRSVPADPLAVAGIRLDSAAGAFRDYCASAALGDEAEAPFARLESDPGNRPRRLSPPPRRPRRPERSDDRAPAGLLIAQSDSSDAPRHCERSAAIQNNFRAPLDCHGPQAGGLAMTANWGLPTTCARARPSPPSPSS